MIVEFLEHPSRRDFTRELDEPLPPVYDVPGPMRWNLEPNTDNSRPIRLKVRRFRLETFNGVPRYIWEGWRER